MSFFRQQGFRGSAQYVLLHHSMKHIMMDHFSSNEAKINQWGQPGSFVTKFLLLLPPWFYVCWWWLLVSGYEAFFSHLLLQSDSFLILSFFLYLLVNASVKNCFFLINHMSVMEYSSCCQENTCFFTIFQFFRLMNSNLQLVTNEDF